MAQMTEQALAEAVAEAMYARDPAVRAFGIRIDHVAPGHARLSMPVREDMLNGHGLCHGGMIFTLADSAFAYACNSRNQNTVASGCTIVQMRWVHIYLSRSDQSRIRLDQDPQRYPGMDRPEHLARSRAVPSVREPGPGRAAAIGGEAGRVATVGEE